MHINGCMEMYGAAIRLALEDFQYVHKYYNKLTEERKREVSFKRNHSEKLKRMNSLLHNYETAKNFLFGKTGLEQVIEHSGLPIDIMYIRRLAVGELLDNQYDKMKGLL